MNDEIRLQLLEHVWGANVGLQCHIEKINNFYTTLQVESKGRVVLNTPTFKAILKGEEKYE